jgi:purine-binding chemotaxis protein CheW
MPTKRFVTFHLDDRLYGLDILTVQEINRYLEITPVPHAPEHVRGLVNLRGQIVNIFDLGVKLGLARREINPDSHNVVLKSMYHESGEESHEEKDRVGLLVDMIAEVVETDEKDIEPPPANIGGGDQLYVSGVVRLEDDLVAILDAKELLQ